MSHICMRAKLIPVLFFLIASTLLPGQQEGSAYACAEMPADEDAGELVASICRRRVLDDGMPCSVQIDVRQLKDGSFQALVQDTSPADAKKRLNFHPTMYGSAVHLLFKSSHVCGLTPLQTDACSGMGLYRVSEEGDTLSYRITDTAQNDIFEGSLPMVSRLSRPITKGRPGCWGYTEFPAEPMQPAIPLTPPSDTERVCYMLVDVPLGDGKVGKLGVHIYRQGGGLLFITEDVTPGGPAPFCVSDISFGMGKLASGEARCVIGPSYNGYFTPQCVVRRGIGRFFLADKHIMDHYHDCVSVSFDFRVCDAEDRELTSFTAEVDISRNELPQQLKLTPPSAAVSGARGSFGDPSQAY